MQIRCNLNTMKRHICDITVDEKEDVDLDPPPYLTFYKSLGEGTYGKVYFAKFGNDPKGRAIKILKSNHSFSVDTPPIIRELLVGGTCSERAGVIRFDSGLYGIISDVGHCTLQSVSPDKIPIDCARILMKQLIEQIILIHKKNCMHRDIKPENILLKFYDSKKFPEIEIIDYGLSTPSIISEDSNVTSLWWRSPEVILGLPHTKSLDIWSFGVILANLCCDSKITTSFTERVALNDIWKVIGFPSKDVWDISDYIDKQNIVGRGFLIEKTEKTKSLCDLLKNILNPNPENRPTGEEILLHPFFSELHILNEETTKWFETIKLKYNKQNTDIIPSLTFTKPEAFLSSSFLDSTYVESDAIYLSKALNSLSDDYLKIIKSISIYCNWDQSITDQCILITDRTLNGSVFYPTDPKALVSAAAYVTGCLYDGVEPNMKELKKWTKMEGNILIIENGVHAVLNAMKYRLLNDKVCTKIMKMEKWNKIKKIFL